MAPDTNLVRDGVSRLMGLAPDLRNQINELIIPQGQMLYLPRPHRYGYRTDTVQNVHHISMPAITQVIAQTRQEALGVL